MSNRLTDLCLFNLQVWGGMSPFSSTAWAANNWDAPIVENAYAAMSALRAVSSRDAAHDTCDLTRYILGSQCFDIPQ
jgi:DICT domain-containing protein